MGDEAAPPLVCLHGLGATWTAWRAVGERLADSFRVVLPDLPGFGRSPAMPDGRFPLYAVAERLEEALDELGVRQAVVAGHSMGGGMAIVHALARPRDVRALVLVAPAGLIATGAVRRIWRQPLLHRLSREVTRAVAPALPRSHALRRRAFAGLVDDPQALDPQTMAELAAGSVAARSTGAAGTAIVHAGLRDRLDRLTMPALVVFGERDRVIDPTGGPLLAAALPSAELLLLPQTGHLPMIERPDEVSAAIRELVAAHTTHA
jgi:pimeloyl-ACP methyl ester carboxylesterase